MAKCGKGCMPECECFTTGGCISPFNCPYKIEHESITTATSTPLNSNVIYTDETYKDKENARLTAERNDSKIEYHGYHTYVRYSAADKILYGKIEDIKDLVDFESESAVEIENEFHKAVDDYIAFCKEVGKGVEEEKGE